MKYIFLDTDVYVNCALMHAEKYDADLITKLKSAIEKTKTKLLLPDIVECEYYRKQDEVFEQLRATIQTIKKGVEKIEFPSYLSNEKQEILRQLDKIIENRKLNREKVNKVIASLFTSRFVEKIGLRPEIFIAGYKRALRGLTPFRMAKVDSVEGKINVNYVIHQDCLIIECLIDFFSAKGSDMLFFCSANHNDFAIFEEGGKRHVIHPEIKRDFKCEVIYYKLLPELIKSELRTAVSTIEIDLFSKISESTPASALTAASFMDLLQTPYTLTPNGMFKDTFSAAIKQSSDFQKYLNDLVEFRMRMDKKKQSDDKEGKPKEE